MSATRAARALILSVLLAGCTSNGDPSVTGSSPGNVGPSFDDETGALAGSVLDDSLLPVPNTTLELRLPTAKEAHASTTANEEGRFAFDRVAPGQWIVAARHEHYAPAFTYVEVRPGEVADVQFVMTTIASLEPYAVLSIKNGVVGCWAAAIVARSWCVPPQVYPAFPETTRLQHEIPTGHQLTVAETVWHDSTVSFAIQYNVRQTSGWRALTLVPADNPPTRFDMAAAQSFVYNPYSQTGTNVRNAVPNATDNWTLETSNGYAGAFRPLINATFGPACRQVYGFCFGVGVATQLRFAQYVTAFVHALPPDASKYSAVPDG